MYTIENFFVTKQFKILYTKVATAFMKNIESFLQYE